MRTIFLGASQTVALCTRKLYIVPLGLEFWSSDVYQYFVPTGLYCQPISGQVIIRHNF
jgi:hypothetical protein